MNAERTHIPRFVAARIGQVLDLGDHRIYIVLSASEMASDIVIAEVEVDPGGGPPRHLHTREDEIFLIQAGRFAFQIGDEAMEAGPGDSLFAPRKIPHAWRCISEEPARMVCLLTPGTNFEAFAQAIVEQQLSLTSAEEVGRVLALAEKHGIQHQV